MTDTPSKGKILLLDDDKFLLDMYAMKFSAAGYTMESCFSTKEALEVLRGGYNPDAILFDLIMPDLDGFSFLEAMSKEKLAPKALKIVFTNESDGAGKQKAVELGAALCFVKAQMIPSEVVNTVTEELAKHHA